jgi:hypothetical protein
MFQERYISGKQEIADPLEVISVFMQCCVINFTVVELHLQ